MHNNEHVQYDFRRKEKKKEMMNESRSVDKQEVETVWSSVFTQQHFHALLSNGSMESFFGQHRIKCVQ